MDKNAQKVLASLNSSCATDVFHISFRHPAGNGIPQHYSSIVKRIFGSLPNRRTPPATSLLP